MLYDSSFVTAYSIVVVTVFGLAMGSFLNCLAWRMMHGESVLHGRSHCTTCGHALAARDLVPVLSWVLSRGRCRYCGERVSARYPATELLCAVLYVGILLTHGLTLETVELVAFVSVLLVLSLTDLDDYLIPNVTIIVAILIRLVYLLVLGLVTNQPLLPLLGGSVLNCLAVGVPILVLSLVMDRVLGKESMGGGDVKLLFVAGMYFGWQQCLFLLVLACVLGIVMGMLGARAHAKTDESDSSTRLIPFGPAIALSCWVTMLVGSDVVSWYLGLFHG